MSIISIRTSPACQDEKRYVLEWVFSEVFGVNFECVFDKQAKDFELLHAGRKLTIDSTFFEAADRCWLGSSTLPEHPIARRRIGSCVCTSAVPDDFVAPFARPDSNAVFTLTEGEVEGDISCDIFGTIFFLISRYEEAVLSDRDDHDRFPAAASMMGRENLLDRPLVNELIELLWVCMKQLWPGLQRRKRKFRVLPSHDMDAPAALWRPVGGILASWFHDVKRANIKGVASLGVRTLRYACLRVTKQWDRDPNDTINWIMDQAEENGLTSCFYYIPEKTSGYDPGMAVTHPHVIDQWKRIAGRGHEIGLHPGYDTYLQADRIATGAKIIREHLNRTGITQTEMGGRQHYLRWQTPTTAQAWDSAGAAYDSTLGFADVAGFRCGTCYEFPLYDLQNRCSLSVRERPLVVMECTVIDDRYMNLGRTTAAVDYMISLKDTCRKYNGDFTILWHNQRFQDERERSMYSRLLKA